MGTVTADHYLAGIVGLGLLRNWCVDADANACGTGRQAALLHELGCSTVGLDQSEAMLAIAHEKLPEAQFEVGDVEHLPFADDEFDLAIVSLALCHLADPGEAVAELARGLQPGGVLVITDPTDDVGAQGLSAQRSFRSRRLPLAVVGSSAT